MTSTLSWLDHDTDARERMNRVLALFEERDTVDELGLGPIRDAFSDRLFPGTSTIQTRLRYFLFVPWVYRKVEAREVSSSEVADAGRELEYQITESLLEGGEEEGVFGKEAGRKLKRLASEVYWGGLGEWGIRRYDGSKRRYHEALDAIYRRRDRLASEAEDGGPARDPFSRTWDPGLPDPPDYFPEKPLTFSLTREEAEYLRERVKVSHPDSLLAHLFFNAEPADCQFPWQHPIWSELDNHHRETLTHARLFSKVAQGATLLYNLTLAEEDGREDKTVEYRERLGEWEQSLDAGELDRWDTDRLWQTVEGQGHTITAGARRFVERWVDRCLEAESVIWDDHARGLVREREIRVKGARALFQNQRKLDEWSGASGLGRFDYRWPEVTTYLEDLHTGLEDG